MAKLYFYYAAMNAGKSTTLLQAAFNYHERGMATMVWTAQLDKRGAAGQVNSRIGLAQPAHLFSPDSDIAAKVIEQHRCKPIACVLIDEAQFLSKAQVWQCAALADQAGIPVLCYGLRTDFQGELFAGSAILLGIADTLVELKAVCECGRKASMNLRIDGEGRAVIRGKQTEISGNERYIALCRRHYRERIDGKPDQYIEAYRGEAKWLN